MKIPTREALVRDPNEKFPFAEGRADWCPYTNKHVHRFCDYGSWVDHRHPQCDLCGYVDVTRELPKL